MKILNSDCHDYNGLERYYMPAEYEPHEGTMMIWPYREGSWPYGARKAREAFRHIIWELAKREEVYVLVRKVDWEEAEKMLIWDWYEQNTGNLHLENGMRESLESAIEASWLEEKKVTRNIILSICDTDDAWARDTGPTYVLEKPAGGQESKDCKKQEKLEEDRPTGGQETENKKRKRDRKGINWQFNAWGGSYDGLYASWEKDQQVAKNLCYLMGDSVIDATHFILEGGSIHVDGQGTLMTTEECLLSPGRNAQMNREEIEDQLIHLLGVDKVLWIPEGIYNDETNGHVDNMCSFTGPGQVVLAWTDDENDPQYPRSRKAYDYLSQVTDAQGRKLTIHKLPIPKKPICITEKDLEGYVFEEGEDQREVGERLAASYVNYYVANGCVLVPQFGDENDSQALKILGKCFPDREIVPIAAMDILLGGGNIHCITQQIPAR